MVAWRSRACAPFHVWFELPSVAPMTEKKQLPTCYTTRRRARHVISTYWMTVMIEEIRKLAPMTQASYLHAVRNFTHFLGRSPDTAKAEETSARASR